MNAHEQATNLFAIGIYYWLTGEERQAEEYWSLAHHIWVRRYWPGLNNHMQFPS